MIITRTPYRVSLMGGGTDFPAFFRERGGLVISAAVNRHFYVSMARRLDDSIRLSYSKTETVQTSRDLEHDLARTVLTRYDLHSGLEIGMIGEVPGGTGLGSSSAVTVGLLHAVRTFFGLECSADTLAKESVIIETELLNKPIGWQDQYGVAFPALKKIRFNRDDTVQVEPIVLTPENRTALEAHSLLVYTGKTRKAETVLSSQSSNMDVNQSSLEAIRSVAQDMMAVLQDSPLDLPLMGSMLSESWVIKRTFAANVANPEIDEWYQSGIASGAWGGKLLGAGGGGFMLFLVPAEQQAAMLSRMGNPPAFPLVLDSTGSQLIYESGSRRSVVSDTGRYDESVPEVAVHGVPRPGWYD